jgi:hypothetical protein
MLNLFKDISEQFMNANYTERGFSSYFGVRLLVMVEIWSYIGVNQVGVTPEHLVWTLYFLKNNPKDDVNNFKVSS